MTDEAQTKGRREQDYPDMYGRTRSQAALEEAEDPHEHSYATLQWKGTDACMDLHCSCGGYEHVDDSFMYFWDCPLCGAEYEVDGRVSLKPLKTGAHGERA